MSDCPMLISNKLHSFRNFILHLLIYIKIQNHAEEYDALQKRSFITYEKLYKAVENRKI